MTSRQGANVVGGAVNKTLTIIGNRSFMTSNVDTRVHKDAVSVEIHSNKCWMGGSTVPLRAFRLFKLPQNSEAYSERTRDELVDRCLSRARRVSTYIYM